jgi:hypothetical protein
VPTAPDGTLVIPHPPDLLFSKLERHDENDFDHIRRILREFPLTEEKLRALTAEMPHRTGKVTDPERRARFEHGLQRLEALVK